MFTFMFDVYVCYWLCTSASIFFKQIYTKVQLLILHDIWYILKCDCYNYIAIIQTFMKTHYIFQSNWL